MLAGFMYVWENANWSVVFVISFMILFKDRAYIYIFQTSWKRRTWKRIVEIKIYEQSCVTLVSFDDRDWYARSLRCFFRIMFIYFM